MIFSYLKITSQISRPIIPVILKSQDKFIIYSGLVDSGSDYCVFDISVAEILGVNLVHNESINIRGVSGDLLRSKIGILELKVGQKYYKIDAVFAKLGKFNFGILGTKGFFDHFDVKLSYRKHIIEIQPASRLSS
jgi:hypothetical protein